MLLDNKTIFDNLLSEHKLIPEFLHKTPEESHIYKFANFDESIKVYVDVWETGSVSIIVKEDNKKIQYCCDIEDGYTLIDIIKRELELNKE